MPVDEPWNMKPPRPHVEPSARWIRARVGETVLADSRRAMLLAWYGPGRLPTYALPAEDVRTDRFTSSAGAGTEDFLVDHDIDVDGRVLTRAARLFRDPPSPMRGLDGHWTFTWDEGVAWFEEAMEVHVHARDTSKRVDVLPSERHVRVEIDGEVVADSGRPHALFESWLPTRWYLPPDDVKDDLLVASDTTSDCPYKGHATYWSVRTARGLHPDVLWTYTDPVVECPRIAGLISFFNERVDLVVDGVLQERPLTPWSHGAPP